MSEKVRFLRRFFKRKSSACPSSPEANPDSIVHKLIITGSQILTYSGPQDAVCAPNQTVVLLRCSGCGEHTTRLLAGFWEMADLLRTESAIAELERMAR